MTTVTRLGETIHLSGELPRIGTIAPDFCLTRTDLSDATLADYAGKRKVLSIVPSLDTPTCAMSARQFNVRAAALADTVVLNISADLPFAAARFCETEGIEGVEALSMMRDHRFATDYGVLQLDGPMAGLAARAVLVLDRNNLVIHTELVPEIRQEADYTAALAALETIE
ncbi:thiol peroxidase [Spiribacter vilamensis]|uniref:Thiol peroxidase n=1 Tax=Spiribacter vilamensis TaxID=531306 RepID=A0A4Q8D0P1_9GAMM|nr:thiol peroxidase [Spiribacter vilamensis]RZU98790.1 thiol peroxidase (atypical 2-Cys peroxiredoxin) [Spiribacter vilamensis]TVO62189.1 thiol peroxidase [Spiribacter vilamensis]